MRKWFIAIYLFSSHKKGISSNQLAKDISVTKKSTWFMLQRIREVMKNDNDNKFDRTTEIDEAYLGGSETNEHGCKKNYTIRTGTIFQGTHKSIEVWQEYIELFSQGKSLPYISRTMKINIKTAFYWRHKILKVLTKQDDNNKLGGIVEADETFFEESQKGSRRVCVSNYSL